MIKAPAIWMRYLYLRFVKKRLYRPYYSNFHIGIVSTREVSFFGYYNVSPENSSGDIVYCSPTVKGAVDLHVKIKGIDRVIATTQSYNLQQGCMEQWGYTHDKNLYYNHFNAATQSYEAVKVNVETGLKETFPLPIYSLSKQEDFYLSLNFERLAKMRPDYGYSCKQVDFLPDNERDGIWRVGMSTKTVKLIISLQQLIDLNPSDTMQGAQHKVNHIDISPDGKRFMFLHRWIGPAGRYMRLITAKYDGSDLFILNGDKMTSHSFWRDSNHIVSFCHTEQYGNAYVEFTDCTAQVRKLSDKLPIRDGHPSTFYNEWMVTDTYPDLSRYSRLLLYNLNTNELIELGRFYQPLKYNGAKRIDLHPKWNRNGTKVYFESGHNGKRSLCYMDVSEFTATIEK